MIQRGQSLVREAQSLNMARHNQAEQLMRAELGIPTLYEKLDPQTKKAWAAALGKLTQRSVAYNGREDPLAVANELIGEYKPQLDAQTRVDETALRSGLRYGTAPEAIAGHQRGEYDATELGRQLDKLTRLQELGQRRTPAGPAMPPGPVAPVPGQPGASGVPVEKQGSLLPGPLKGFDTRNAPTGPLGPQKRPTR